MTPDGGNGLRRTSSLLLSSPTKSSTPGKRPRKVDVEAVPGSEEDHGKKTRGVFMGEIIELSDSDDTVPSLGTMKTMVDNRQSDPFLSSPKEHASKQSEFVVQESESEIESDVQPRYAPKTVKAPWTRRTVISDSEDELEAETHTEVDVATDMEPANNNDDGAILVFNDAPSSRKPASRDGEPPSKAKPKRTPVLLLVHSTPSGGQAITANPSPVQTPVLPRPKGVPGKQAKLPDFFALGGKSREKSSTKDYDETCTLVDVSLRTAKPITPARAESAAKRKTKKALLQEKQAHLAGYAQALFDELNALVFKNKLPKETPLVWNNRLLATAGRAKWHRDSKGVESTCIELATKVLDCEERIRNTLSHEMCHLACWVINCNPKENHGRVWQGWVEEVMEKRPDIAISTKHSYDITYKYEWQCQTPTCKKIYGRHSNSINPEKSICGVCKIGDLVPLFKTRARKTKATGKMAGNKTHDSPVLSARGPARGEKPSPPLLKPVQHDVEVFVASDSETDLDGGPNADTDADEYDAFIPKDRSDVDSGPKNGKVNTKGSRGTDDFHKLVTHLSIIDLTND